MRTLSLVLLALGVLLGAFAYWGVFTRAGSAHFDEMDGLIPFGAGIAALLLLLAGAAVTWWLRMQ